ncbi:MAG: reverse transcriptase/maturase family protein [Parcubacteria group bacterium]
MKIQLTHGFEKMISVENLLVAWKEFARGKKHRKDVQAFSLRLMDNIFALHEELSHHTYNHGGYQAFKINDPKPRDIHKASVRDRLVHHAIYRILYPFFDKTFIADSYSCRNEKGTHRAINKFQSYFYKVSQNNTRTCWILKCDIRKFFANIDHQILLSILAEYILDKNIMKLLENIIASFYAGLPLGNLTSQLFVNSYMNRFDQFVKHKLKAKYYIRYADDFVFLSEDKKHLKEIIPTAEEFLKEELKLEMHPNKVFIKTLSSGVDFLGRINFFDYRILRTKTRRRMLRRMSLKQKMCREELVSKESLEQSVQSYLGILRHCRGYAISKKLSVHKPGFLV